MAYVHANLRTSSQFNHVRFSLFVLIRKSVAILPNPLPLPPPRMRPRDFLLPFTSRLLAIIKYFLFSSRGWEVLHDHKHAKCLAFLSGDGKIQPTGCRRLFN
jgi:hypothetical protein